MMHRLWQPRVLVMAGLATLIVALIVVNEVRYRACNSNTVEVPVVLLIEEGSAAFEAEQQRRYLEELRAGDDMCSRVPW